MDKLTTQQGLTLIELMIAMVLGLLVIAAAISIFLAGQRSLATQTGLSELQQTAIFGLSQLAYNVRHANLNTGSKIITKSEPNAGIVFGTDGTQEESNDNQMYNNIRNDQLTIRFAPNESGSLPTQLADCTGNPVTNPVITTHRYHIQQIPNTSRYGLYCNDTLVIPDAEAFKVRFGVRDNGNSNMLRYKTISNLANSDHITSVELNLILRSTNTVGSNSMIDDSRTFAIAGQNDVTLRNQNQNPKYLREVFTQVVALRNDQGS